MIGIPRTPAPWFENETHGDPEWCRAAGQRRRTAARNAALRRRCARRAATGTSRRAIDSIQA